jgi:sugar phosphate isomerase/epimerase
MKDVWVRETPGPCGILGGHLDFGDYRRAWDFKSIGFGGIKFMEVITALKTIGYSGPWSIEWEHQGMDPEWGVTDSYNRLTEMDYATSTQKFDETFERK